MGLFRADEFTTVDSKSLINRQRPFSQAGSNEGHFSRVPFVGFRILRVHRRNRVIKSLDPTTFLIGIGFLRRLSRRSVVRHLHKAETFGASGVAIRDDLNRFNLADLAVDLRQCLGHLGVVPDAPALTLIAFF